ncbi:hypothetical protein FF38_03378 [Lucilia cuprina]|uniref:Uncharacterized protein n=1 Tax=Lucilia cuprina TaxID=7375 RepID=A0A0L0BQ26_LUCCU|nr:hypothetical protein FF38_03378 [Lucilia cuprina]
MHNKNCSTGGICAYWVGEATPEYQQISTFKIIASIRAICGQRGIKKGLRDIIKPEVLDLYNLDGTHNKLRLLNFPKLCMFYLVAGTYCEGNTDKTFKSDIRDALKIAKNRYCKEKRNLLHPKKIQLQQKTISLKNTIIY